MNDLDTYVPPIIRLIYPGSGLRYSRIKMRFFCSQMHIRTFPSPFWFWCEDLHTSIYHSNEYWTSTGTDELSIIWNKPSLIITPSKKKKKKTRPHKTKPGPSPYRQWHLFKENNHRPQLPTAPKTAWYWTSRDKKHFHPIQTNFPPISRPLVPSTLVPQPTQVKRGAKT